MAKKLHIVSLGSSFASGPGILPQDEPAAARRSTKNYPHLLASHLNARLTDLTVAGATLLNLTTEPQTAVFSKHIFRPQISQLPPANDVDIVTVTGGGNDIGYITGIVKDEWDASWIGTVSNFVLQVVKKLASFISTPEEEIPAVSSPDRILIDRLSAVVDEIHQKLPNAHIYLVEYLAVLGPDTKPGRDVGFDQTRIDHHRHLASVMSTAYDEVITADRSKWCTRVPTNALSQEHAIGSQEPWVEGFSLQLLFQRGPIFHPNLKGMEAVARMLIDLIEQNDRKGLHSLGLNSSVVAESSEGLEGGSSGVRLRRAD